MVIGPSLACLLIKIFLMPHPLFVFIFYLKYETDTIIMLRDVSSVSTVHKYQWNSAEGMMLNADMAIYKVKHYFIKYI